MSEITGQDEARRALTVDQQELLDALTYFRPHWATNGPVMLTADKMREHLAVIEGTLRNFAEAALRAPSLDRGAEEMEDRLDRYEEALHDIQRWSEAYPLSVFPEPDLKKARALLEAGGMTLDSISAYCMRHVVEGVGKIARRALPVPADLNEGEAK